MFEVEGIRMVERYVVVPSEARSVVEREGTLKFP